MNLRSAAATKGLGAAGLVLVAGAGWFLAVGPETDRLSEVEAQVTSAREQNDLLGIQLAALKAQAADLDDTRDRAEALALRFPATADQPGLFREVTRAAADAGIGARDVTALTPTPPTVGEAGATGAQLAPDASEADLARQSVSVAVEGSYRETRRLLDNLEQMPRAYLITSITLSAGSEPSTFTTSIDGDMFVMPPVEDPEIEEELLTD
jgi:Tfp pilus assembly protein PilO